LLPVVLDSIKMGVKMFGLFYAAGLKAYDGKRWARAVELLNSAIRHSKSECGQDTARFYRDIARAWLNNV
jgi:hypothetical protein